MEQTTERVVDTAATAADAAATQTREMTATAADATRQVSSTAAEQAKEVTSTVREQVGDVASEAAAQTRHVADEARAQLRQQAASQTDRIVESLRRLADEASGLADGRQADGTVVRDYLRQAAGKVREVADRVDREGYEGVINDAQRFARRRPGTFLLGAAAAGFAVGRFIRGTKASSEADQAATPTLPAIEGAAPPVVPLTPGPAPADAYTPPR